MSQRQRADNRSVAAVEHDDVFHLIGAEQQLARGSDEVDQIRFPPLAAAVDFVEAVHSAVMGKDINVVADYSRLLLDRQAGDEVPANGTGKLIDAENIEVFRSEVDRSLRPAERSRDWSIRFELPLQLPGSGCN